MKAIQITPMEHFRAVASLGAAGFGMTSFWVAQRFSVAMSEVCEFTFTSTPILKISKTDMYTGFQRQLEAPSPQHRHLDRRVCFANAKHPKSKDPFHSHAIAGVARRFRHRLAILGSRAGFGRDMEKVPAG
jgi:hypothetical protein